MASHELVDLKDKDGRVIVKVFKSDIYNATQGDFSVVHGLLFDKDRNVLLQKLSESKREPYRYGSSFAGIVLSHEYPQLTAIRKVAEEIGLPNTPLAYLGSSGMDIGNSRTKHVHVFVGPYKGPVEPNNLPFDKTQIERLDLVPWSDVYPINAERRNILSSTFPVVVEKFVEYMMENPHKKLF